MTMSNDADATVEIFNLGIQTDWVYEPQQDGGPMAQTWAQKHQARICRRRHSLVSSQLILMNKERQVEEGENAERAFEGLTTEEFTQFLDWQGAHEAPKTFDVHADDAHESPKTPIPDHLADVSNCSSGRTSPLRVATGSSACAKRETDQIHSHSRTAMQNLSTECTEAATELEQVSCSPNTARLASCIQPP